MKYKTSFYESLYEGSRFLYRKKDKKEKNVPDTGAHPTNIAERQLMMSKRISAMIDAIVIDARISIKIAIL